MNPYADCVQPLTEPTIPSVRQKIQVCRGAERYLRKLPGVGQLSESEYPALRTTVQKILALEKQLDILQRVPACDECLRHSSVAPKNIHDLKESIYQCYECMKKQIYQPDVRRNSQRIFAHLEKEFHKRIKSFRESTRKCVQCQISSFQYVIKSIETQAKIRKNMGSKTLPLKALDDYRHCLESMFHNCTLEEKYAPPHPARAQLLIRLKEFYEQFSLILLTPPPVSPQVLYEKILHLVNRYK